MKRSISSFTICGRYEIFFGMGNSSLGKLGHMLKSKRQGRWLGEVEPLRGVRLVLVVRRVLVVQRVRLVRRVL